MVRQLPIHYLHSQQIFFVLVCIREGNPRVPPRVLASGPKPSGGNKQVKILLVKILNIFLVKLIFLPFEWVSCGVVDVVINYKRKRSGLASPSFSGLFPSREGRWQNLTLRIRCHVIELWKQE